MRSVEVTGKTLEEARGEAARELNVSEDELAVEVLEEPRRLLGLLAGHEVRIRATVAGGEEEAPVEPDDSEAAEVCEPQAPTPQDELEADADTADDTADDATEDRAVHEIVAQKAAAVVSEMLQLMGTDACAVATEQSESEVIIDIQGQDVGMLIGRHGATLNALQLITTVIVNRGDRHGVRILLDAEGYRDRRRQMLEEMAEAHAAQVKAAQKEIVITDLKPYERRIVHMALKDDPDVETYSEGEGDARYIVISPPT